MYIQRYTLSTQHQDKMKTKLENIALEGTCNGDIAGGLLSWTGENLQALLFLKGGGIMSKEKAQSVVVDSADVISHTANRLKLLYTLSMTSLASQGELEAFCDASHRILKDDIDRLEEVAQDLNFLSDSD